MRKIAFFAGVSLLSWAFPAVAEQCTAGEVTRIVQVVYAEPGQPVPCEVVYDKTAEGQGIETLWRAHNEAGYCEARADEFLTKLEDLGFVCTNQVEETASH